MSNQPPALLSSMASRVSPIGMPHRRMAIILGNGESVVGSDLDGLDVTQQRSGFRR